MPGGPVLSGFTGRKGIETVAMERRLICDGMLARLARWLRAAGYDTELASKEVNDRDLMARALDDDLLILSRDRKLLERRGATSRVFLIHYGRINEQAREITRPLGIDWLKAPFSRCLVDNHSLRPARAEEIADFPWPRETVSGSFMSCPQCRRLYWDGSHTRRMRGNLEAWSRGHFGT